MQRTATQARPRPARSVTLKEAASGIRAWVIDVSIAIALIGGLALATAITSH